MDRLRQGVLGIPALDGQHQALFARFVSIKEIMARGGSWNDLHAALAGLIRCCEFCFAVEEALMQIQAYRDCDAHRQEHQDLLLNLQALERAVLTNALTERLIGAAFAAAMKHHLSQDRRCARELSRPGGLESLYPMPA